MKPKPRSTCFWIICIAVLLALSCAALFLLPRLSVGGTIANIYVDGECRYSIDLSQVTKPTSFTIETEAGSNTVTVEPGRIRISEADCPDQICVNQGWITGGITPVVCLPHQVVIQIQRDTATANVDIVSQ